MQVHLPAGSFAGSFSFAGRWVICRHVRRALTRHFSDTVIHWRWSMGKKAVRVHEAVFNSRSLRVSVNTVKQLLLTSERNQLAL